MTAGNRAFKKANPLLFNVLPYDVKMSNSLDKLLYFMISVCIKYFDAIVFFTTWYIIIINKV